MSDELAVCAAAFFRNKGKDVIADKEFTMCVSLDFRWMPVKEANTLLKMLLDNKILEKNGNLLRTVADLSDVDVPVAYRPSEKLLSEIKNYSPGPEKKKENNIFADLVDTAEKTGIKKGEFISECNNIVKRLNIDTEVAALIVLRDRGADITRFADDAYECVIRK